MKKIFTLIGFIACIAIIGLAFFGCKEEGSPTHKCPSLDVHYLTCEEYGCTIGGHTQKALGGYDNQGYNFPIYQTKDVEFDDAVTAAESACLMLSAVGSSAVSGKITAIYIVSGDAIDSTKNADGKYIVSIGSETDLGSIYGHFATQITKGNAPCLLPFLACTIGRGGTPDVG